MLQSREINIAYVFSTKLYCHDNVPQNAIAIDARVYHDNDERYLMMKIEISYVENCKPTDNFVNLILFNR